MTAPPLSNLLMIVRPIRRPGRFEGEEDPRVPSVLDDEEVRLLSNYLEEPTQHGYWRLNALWNYGGKFSEFVYNQQAEKFFQGDENANTNANRARSALLGPALSADQEQFINQAFGRISTLNEIFFLASQGSSATAKTVSQEIASIGEWQRSIDLDAFRASFEQAIEIFRSRILFDGFKTAIRNSPFRIKNGILFSIRGPRESERISFASMTPTCLEDMREFLLAAGQVTDTSLSRVFSPEEELFQPYFSSLSAVFGRVINDSRVRPQFQQAFDYYSKHDFTHCVSTLGLLAEDYLTQVYETYLREPCPRGQTLGQIYDSLHNRIREQTAPIREELKSVDATYESIQDLQRAAQSDDALNTKERLLTLIREVLTIIKADRKYFSQRIDDVHRRDQRVSVFPPLLRENINELIRYRNAASHKTRIPLGNYEALRALYCLTSLVMWWKKVYESTSWAEERLPILRSAIARVGK